jgi:septal ring factor EnvC (AmiA/AmiB activator)
MREIILIRMKGKWKTPKEARSEIKSFKKDVAKLERKLSKITKERGKYKFRKFLEDAGFSIIESKKKLRRVV